MDEADCIVNLSSQTHQNKLFCVHPIGGSILFYKKIADALESEFTTYGIKSPHRDKNDKTINTIEEIAKKYNAYIKDYLSDGHVTLLGWSMGGLIAFEMAKQLAAQGKQPVKVILIDTYEPAYLPSTEKMDFDEFYFHMMRMLQSGIQVLDDKKWPKQTKILLTLLTQLKIPFSLVKPIVSLFGLKHIKEDMITLKNNLGSPDTPLTPIPEWIKFGRKLKMIPVTISDEQMLNSYQLIRLHLFAYRQYKPGYYKGSIVFLKAKFGYKEKLNQSEWTQYSRSVTNYIVAADHYNIVTNKEAIKDIKTDDEVKNGVA